MNIIANVVRQRLSSLSVVLVVIATLCVYAFAIDQEKPDSELGSAVTKRPVVTIEGFFDDKATGETYAFLVVQVVDTTTFNVNTEAKHVRVRKGEEFYNARLVDFVGDKKGVTLEYLKIPGSLWKVMAP